MTKREFLEAVTALENTELVEFATAELAKMDAANAKRRNTPSKAAVQNAQYLVEVKALLAEATEPMTAAQIAEALNVTAQKATAVCAPAARDGELAVVKVKSTSKSGGKVNAYSLPAAE